MISRIGKYTVESELGRGGFGQVYKAWDPDVRQSVAIKVLLAEGDPDLLRRFQLEVVTTASLHHKNIVTIHASGEEAGTPYLVMEFLEGQTLGQVIKQRTALPLMEKVRIMTQVAEGLAYAHSKGVVHRDVKPANIMLLPDGSVKIMDFGIALASNRRTVSMTMDGFVVGTVPYMSPEQFTSDLKANEQTDIYSFGAVCYELLTGRHPFEPYLRDLSALRVAILTHDPPAVSHLVPECPDALELLVHRSLAKEREFRYQRFEEVRLDCTSVLVDLEHEQAASILRDVPRLVATGDLQEARAMVREAQKLEPGNRQARQLLESIDQKLQDKINRERITQRLAEAEKHISNRCFAEAVQTLETAAKLDTSNVVVQMRLVEAKARLEGAVQANRLVEDARSRQQRGEIGEALDRLDRALDLDPEHTEARRLRPKLNEQLLRRQREQARQRALAAASEHLAAKRYSEASSILENLEKEEPGAAGLAELRREIEREKAEEERRVRAERFSLALARTRETIQAGELERAGQMLAHLKANFAAEPGAAEVLPLLTERLDALLRAREIAACRERANNLVKQQSFGEASELLAEALSRYPDDSGLMRQKASVDALHEAHKRAEAIAAVLKQSNSRRDAGDLAGALAALADGRREFGNQPAFLSLSEEIEQQRYAAGLQALLESVRALLASGAHSEAVARITAAEQYGKEAEVLGLLDSARAAAALAEERKFVAEALASAAGLRDGQQWDRAATVLEDALRTYPKNPALFHALDQLRDEIERERRIAIDRRRDAILRHTEAAGWQAADAALRQARAEFPGERAFDDLADRIAAGLREEALQEAVSRIRQTLVANKLSEAIEQLENTRPVYARDPRWKALEQDVVRRREYEAALEEAELRRREGDMAKAESLLTRVIPDAPDLRATKLFSLIQSQRAEAAGLAQRVRQCLERSDVSQASAELSAARSQYPDDRLWAALQIEIDALRDSLRRQAAIAEAIRASLKRDDLRGAASKLAEGRAKYPNATLWAEVQAEIDARQAFLKRQADMAALANDIRGLVSAGDLRRALSELDAARRKYPDAEPWARLDSEIRARQTEMEARQTGIASAASSVRDCLARGDLRSAASELSRARAKYPGEEIWETLQPALDLRLAEQQRHADIAALADGIRGLVSAGDLRRAASELDAARRKYPDAEPWARLESEIRARQAEMEARQAGIASAANGVRDCLARGDLRRAASELAAARAKYPGEEIWETLQSALDLRRAEQQRQTEVASAAAGIRNHLAQGDPRSAASELAAARARYSGEKLWDALQAEVAALQAEVDARRARTAAAVESMRALLRRGDIDRASAELAAARAQDPAGHDWVSLEAGIDSARAAQQQAKAIRAAVEQSQVLLRTGRIDEALTALRAAMVQFPAEPQLAALLRECEGRLRQREVEEIHRRAEALLAEGKPQEAIASIDSRYAEEPALRELLVRARRELERAQCLAQLLAIEQELDSSNVSRLKERDREARRIAAPFTADPEIPAIAGRIHARVESLLPAPSPRKPIPWKLVAAGSGVALTIAAAVLLLPRLFQKPASPGIPVAVVPFEVRTDPVGAAVRIGDRSCETPNCRFELAPGTYEIEAQLQNYAARRETVAVDASKHLVELTLNPVPVPPPPLDPGQPAAATGTLVVQAGVPDALVYVNGAPRSRTDRTGTLTLDLDARIHDVRVERNGYETPPSRQVRIIAGSRQTVPFSLTRLPAKSEVPPAAPAVTNAPPVSTPPEPAPEILERQQWERVRASNNVAQLEEFLKTYPNSSRSTEARMRIADLQWGAVDQANIESVRRFLREHSGNPHRAEGQRIVDRFEENARLEQARQQELLKQQQLRQQVFAAVKRLDSALQAKQVRDIRAIWPGFSQAFVESMKTPRVRFSLNANEGTISFPNRPDEAILQCDLVIVSDRGTQVNKATFVLRNTGGGWTVTNTKLN